MPDKIFLSPPDIGQEEIASVLEALESGWITTLGPSVESFERSVAEYVGVPYAVATSSGTAALHLALLAVGVEPGDDVLVSTLTFAATANAVVYCGARPVFIDSEYDTWNIDPNLLEEELGHRARSGRHAAAVIVVDVFGQCAQYSAITRLCERYGVPLIEDAAESLGAEWAGRRAGSFGDAAILSFNGNKIMTTSGGGMLLTHFRGTAERTRYLATQAREATLHYEHREVGFNYRFSNVLAGLGIAQLRRLPTFIQRRRIIREIYRERLSGASITFQPSPGGSRPNAWLTAVLFDKPATAETVLKRLITINIEARPIWKPMHLQPAFVGCESRLSGRADDLFARGICLPSGQTMSDEVCHMIAAEVLSAMAIEY